MSDSPKMITNLEDLCNHFHADGPGQLSKRMYRDTSCGASISIHIGPKPTTETRRFILIFALQHEKI